MQREHRGPLVMDVETALARIEGDDPGRPSTRLVAARTVAAELRRMQRAEAAMDAAFDRLNADAVNIANPHDKEAAAYFDQRANGAAIVRAAFKMALTEER